MRFVAPGVYQTVDWPTGDALNKSPGAHARNWAIDVVDSASKAHLGDSFHFEIQNRRDIRGMFRIHDYATAMTLLRASGTKHSSNGERWFVEPVAEGLTSCPPKSCGSRPKMEEDGVNMHAELTEWPNLGLLQAGSS